MSNPATIKQKMPKGMGAEIFPAVLRDFKRYEQWAAMPEMREELAERVEEGIKKYGEPLKAHNGRDALIDGYQELLDAIMYFKQTLVEDELELSDLVRVRKVYDDVLHAANAVRNVLKTKS